MRALLPCLLLLAPLAGCSLLLDGDQLRLCRLTLPAVEDGASLTLLAAAPVRAPYTLRLDYRVEAGPRRGLHHAWCGFGGTGLDAARGTLTAYATDLGPFSPIRTYVLRHFWLDRPDRSVPHDPGPGETERPSVHLGAGPPAYLVQALANALPSTAMTALVAMAYALLYGLVGRINLAFGELATIGAAGTLVAAVALTGSAGLALPMALGLAVAAGVLVAMMHGRVLERLVFAPLAFRPGPMTGQAVLIATLAAGLVLGDYLRLAQGSRDRWLPPLLTVSLPLAEGGGFTARITAMQVLILAGAALLALALVLLMRATPFGRRWRAVSDDPVMASLLGVRREAVLAQSFLLAAGLAGAAGAVMTVAYGGYAGDNGLLVGLKALVAAVVGGIGSVEGALLGGLAIGLFEAVWSAYLPIEQRDLAVLLLLAVTLVLRPGGLLGHAEGRPRLV